MSWLSIPLPNPFKTLQPDPLESPESSPSSPSLHGGAGVKRDLSVLGQTISRQVRGIAAFLAPPPVAPGGGGGGGSVEGSESSAASLLGIRGDLVEIGGSFRSGLALCGMSKLATNFLRNEEVGDDKGGVESPGFDESGVPGINDAVVHFVNEISLRPECWLDFPLSLNYDFNLSNAQKEHASTVLRLAPRFTALKHELCSSMSNGQFWMIYFIMLLQKLDGRSLELLSTPEIVEAREALLQKLKIKSNTEVKSKERQTYPFARIEEHKSAEQLLEKGGPVEVQKQIETEDDASFSDLEEEEEDDPSSRLGRNNQAPSSSGSGEWVQLKESSARNSGRGNVNRLASREKDSEDDSSNEWLAIDGFDSDSSRAT